MTLRLIECARVLIPTGTVLRSDLVRVMSLVGYMLQFITSNCRVYVEISPRYTVSRGGACAAARPRACEATARVVIVSGVELDLGAWRSHGDRRMVP